MMALTSITAAEGICLVDDDPAIRKSVGRLLASEGFGVRPFSEAGPFLEYVASASVPLAIVDVWMEGMTGLEVQSKLRRASPQTKVIVMTGRKDPGVEQTALDDGAFAFFIKPFDDEAFLSAVRRALAA
jgi:FixJ family two-component response regulator